MDDPRDVYLSLTVRRSTKDALTKMARAGEGNSVNDVANKIMELGLKAYADRKAQDH